MDPVVQTRPAHAGWMDSRTRRLPGVQPVESDGWLTRDEAFGGQMALRDRLITERLDEVIALHPAAEVAACELLDLMLAEIGRDAGYAKEAGTITRPDGARVALDRTRPLATLGRLVAEDLCLLVKEGEEHVLRGAVLCFPSSWTLAEKMNRPLVSIHRPVAAYGADIARRVQRIFDGARPGRAMWRQNALLYPRPDLFHPRPEGIRDRDLQRPLPWLRSERQTILRLPESDAVLFAIHTTVTARANLSPEADAELLRYNGLGAA